MPFDFDTVINRFGTDCAKYDSPEREKYPADVLHMWCADMDFPAPDCVNAALQKAVAHGVYGYGIRTEAFYEAVTGWFEKRHGWKPEAEWILQTPGVSVGMAFALRAVTQPGDAVIIFTPVYGAFPGAVLNNGRKLVECPLVYEDGYYRVDFALFETLIREHRVKALSLCSPHNPVGRVWTLEELQRMGGICLRYGLTVLSDEIHCDFTYPEHPHWTLLKACPQLQEQAVICTAASKTFNLAGLHTSNIFIPNRQLRQAVQRELGSVYLGDVNTLGALACQTAYSEGEPWLDALLPYLRSNWLYVRDFLRENLPQVGLARAEGMYFAWLDFTALGLSPEALEELLSQKAGLWLIPGTRFGKDAVQFRRMVLACPRSIVAQAMERLKKAIIG